jgi:hypothetical protein
MIFIPLSWLLHHVGEPQLAHLTWASMALSLVFTGLGLLTSRRLLFWVAAVLSAFTAYVAMLTVGVLVAVITITQVWLAARCGRPHQQKPVS